MRSEALYTDPGLRWLEDDLDPDGMQPELLTVAAGAVWWSAGDSDEDDEE